MTKKFAKKVNQVQELIYFGFLVFTFKINTEESNTLRFKHIDFLSIE